MYKIIVKNNFNWYLTDFLSDLVEMVLYYVLPPDDFSNPPLRCVVIEILVSAVLLPLINLISDPDYINTLIIWAVSTNYFHFFKFSYQSYYFTFSFVHYNYYYDE